MERRPLEWVQLNVALARRSGSALPSARALFRDLEGALLLSPRRGVFSQFFFQRKPPDLRLRFFGSRERLKVRLRPVISRAKSDGHVVQSFYSVYEPEQRQFGGRDCMRCVHAFWETDSMAWIMLDRLVESEKCGIPETILVASILDDLFCRTLFDGGEVWDTWCNLAVLLQCEQEVGALSFDPISLKFLQGLASPAEVVILDRYRQANEMLAERLQRVWRLGRLSSGMRSILPYIALFTLNRYGFNRNRSATIAGTMATVWDPKQHLRGSRPDRPAGVQADEFADPARNLG